MARPSPAIFLIGLKALPPSFRRLRWASEFLARAIFLIPC